MLLAGKHILIVEDNALNRVVYNMALVSHGALIDFDRWGNDTFNMLKGSSHWDLIILDLMLYKGISGFDIFHEIRKIPAYDRVPIVAVSAMEPALAIPRARQLGFSGFISKPIDEALFANQIAQIIAGEPVWHDGTLDYR